MKVKNISGEPLEVAPLGGRVVMPGEEVDVPDHHPWHGLVETAGLRGDDGTVVVEESRYDAPIVWPATVWEPVKKPAVKTDKTETKE